MTDFIVHNGKYHWEGCIGCFKNLDDAIKFFKTRADATFITKYNEKRQITKVYPEPKANQ